MDIQQRTFHKGAIGSDDVKRLIESGDYVDKSLFIKEVIHDNHQVLLITRPRRWGKSSNMSLLKTFLELEVDKEGNSLPDEKKTNPAYFTGGLIGEGKKQVAHEALKISKEAASMEELGQYPVIMMSFKDIVCSSYKTIEAGIQDVLGLVFEHHKYLMFSEHLDTNEKNRLSGYLKGELDLAHLQKIIKDLLSFLYNHFNQKVWVLIDEYDSAIHEAYTTFGKDTKNPYQFSKEFDKVLKLFRKLLGSALKSATHLEKGVVTGILRIAKANLFSTLNNFTEYSVLDEEFAPYYGFTQDEVDMLCQQQGIPPEQRDEIKKWYNGYSYGSLELYNPWSMARCLFHEKHKIKNYWEESGSFGFIADIMVDDAVQKEIQAFMHPPYCQENVYVNNYIDLAALLQADSQTVVSLLLHSGYLNPQDGQRIGDHMVYTLGIPNQEIISAFKNLIKKWGAKKLGSQEGRFNNIEIALLKGDVSLFKERMKDFLESATSFHTIKHGDLKLRESHYHFLMKAILYGMHITKEVFHEQESGNGMIDTVILPRLYQGDQAIILEYKYSQQEEKLEKTAKEALAQIKGKNYIATIMGVAHVKSVLQLGIAFHKKEVEVVHEIVNINV